MRNIGPYLIEGGAAGHMAHPFDDKDLTFSDLKEIVRRALTGKLDLEQKTSEKVDGQNILVSWKDGRMIAARNKSHLKNFGENAMDKKAVATKFAGRGDLTDAFVGAMDDLEKAIGALSPAQREKIFGNGKRFMNLEIIWSKTVNVIPYNRNLLLFHGVIEYDESGTAIESNNEYGRILAGMIKQVNQNVQSNFEIAAPNVLKLPKAENYESQQKAFFKEIDMLRKKYNLKDSDTVMKYHLAWWEEFIRDAAKKTGYNIPDNVLSGLLSRWAYNDKGSYSFNVAKKEIDNQKFLDWFVKTDREDLVNVFKKNIRPFEILFLKLGAQVLRNISNIVAAHPDESIQKIKDQLEKVISDIQSSGDLSVLSKLENELKRLDAIGGMDAIVPIEGVVFTYKGKIFKLTGTFAPVNQIMGLIRYSR